MLTAKPLPLPHHTVYFSWHVQTYMNTVIKKPALKALDILFDPEQSRVSRLKAAKTLWEVFVAFNGLPEPTKENTWSPNSHNLIDLRDWLFDVCHLEKSRMGLIRRAFNFVIVLYDSDPPWRWIMDSAKDRAFEMNWESRGHGDDWSDGYDWWNENNN